MGIDAIRKNYERKFTVPPFFLFGSKSSKAILEKVVGLRSKASTPFALQIVDGIKFYMDRERGYWTSRKGGRLHRYLWQKANGPIPKGYHVHHINGDLSDNSIENLECLSPSDHAKHHWTLDEYRAVKRGQKKRIPMEATA